MSEAENYSEEPHHIPTPEERAAALRAIATEEVHEYVYGEREELSDQVLALFDHDPNLLFALLNRHTKAAHDAEEGRHGHLGPQLGLIEYLRGYWTPPVK